MNRIKLVLAIVAFLMIVTLLFSGVQSSEYRETHPGRPTTTAVPVPDSMYGNGIPEMTLIVMGVAFSSLVGLVYSGGEAKAHGFNRG